MADEPTPPTPPMRWGWQPEDIDWLKGDILPEGYTGIHNKGTWNTDPSGHMQMLPIGTGWKMVPLWWPIGPTPTPPKPPTRWERFKGWLRR